MTAQGATVSRYPAMPYTSYRGMTRADADAIYAYPMQLRLKRQPRTIA